MWKGSRSTTCPSKEERGLWGLSRSTTLDFELQKEQKREAPWEAVPTAGAPWMGVQVVPVPRSLLERCATAIWLPFCPWCTAMSTCRRLSSPIWHMPSVGHGGHGSFQSQWNRFQPHWINTEREWEEGNMKIRPKPEALSLCQLSFEMRHYLGK